MASMKLSLKFSGFACLLLVFALVASCSFFDFITIPKSAYIVGETKQQSCQYHDASDTKVIDVSKPFDIAVWNVYKFKKDNWKDELNFLLANNQLVLLQEAVSSFDTSRYQGWSAYQAYAFKFFDKIAGVMTLSKASPVQSCAFSQNEPILRLPKTALLSWFSLATKEKLAVVNIHSINFTFGLKQYRQQLGAIIESLEDFNGPIIFAGDFNTWDKRRLAILTQALGRLGLAGASFSPDERLTVFSRPLDHIFYRGLTLEKARSKSTEASDHAWLEASFSFN